MLGQGCTGIPETLWVVGGRGGRPPQVPKRSNFNLRRFTPKTRGNFDKFLPRKKKCSKWHFGQILPNFWHEILWLCAGPKTRPNLQKGAPSNRRVGVGQGSTPPPGFPYSRGGPPVRGVPRTPGSQGPGGSGWSSSRSTAASACAPGGPSRRAGTSPPCGTTAPPTASPAHGCAVRCLGGGQGQDPCFARVSDSALAALYFVSKTKLNFSKHPDFFFVSGAHFHIYFLIKTKPLLLL